MFHSVSRIIKWAGRYQGRLYLGAVCSFFASFAAAAPTMVAFFTASFLTAVFFTGAFFATSFFTSGSFTLSFVLWAGCFAGKHWL